MSKRISLCALLYGDHPGLAHRCLSSVWDRLPEGRAHIFDIRIALNEVSKSTRAIVDWFTENTRHYHNIPMIHYDCPVNACKYPLVRRMLLNDSRPPAEFSMWFDDDSYLDGKNGWWDRLLAALATADMIGKIYTQGLRGNQWLWIVNQDWYNSGIGKPPLRKGKPSFIFATGGWWVIRSKIFRDNDWPCPELKHCGGDSMFGELMRHRGYRLEQFEEGTHINANAKGRHSTARPRGESWKRVLLGQHFGKVDKDTSHQDFSMERRTYGCE